MLEHIFEIKPDKELIVLSRLSLFSKNTYFNNSSTIVEPSYLATLVNTIGWFNPFNISAESARKLFYITYLLNKACLANGVACMLDEGDGKAYALICGYQNNQSMGMSDQENLCFQALQVECEMFQLDDCAALYQSPNKLTTNFGPGYFGGHRCELYYFYDPIDTCVVDVLTKILPKKFGTTLDIIATSCLAIGGAATIGGCTAGLYSLCKRYTQTKNYVEITANERTALPIHGSL